MASADGYVSLLDPRTGYKAEHSLLAHAGGFAALDARGELLATCGYANRMGRLSLETYAKVGGWVACRAGAVFCGAGSAGGQANDGLLAIWQAAEATTAGCWHRSQAPSHPPCPPRMPACLPAQVFDVRMTPRMLSSLPFAPGPSILRFHPRFGDTLLLASAGGAFTLANTQGMSCEHAVWMVGWMSGPGGSRSSLRRQAATIQAGRQSSSALFYLSQTGATWRELATCCVCLQLAGCTTSTPRVMRWCAPPSAAPGSAWPLAAAAATCTCGPPRQSPQSTRCARSALLGGQPAAGMPPPLLLPWHAVPCLH